LQNSYTASKNALGNVVRAIAKYGVAAEAMETANPFSKNSQALLDNMVSALDSANIAYGTYVLQLSETMAAAGKFQSTDWNTTPEDDKVLSEINSLPLEVLGWKASQGEIDTFNTALASFGSGSEVMVSHNSTVLAFANDTHTVAEGAMLATGIGSIGYTAWVAGSAVFSEEGLTGFIATAANVIDVNVGKAVVVNVLVNSGAHIFAQEFNVDENDLRMAGDLLQLGLFAKAAMARIPPGGPDLTAELNQFSKAGEYGVLPYNEMVKLTKGTGLQAHHLIEGRFSGILDLERSKMLTIALTSTEHQKFTNEWRRLVPYGTTESVTPAQVLEDAKIVYKNYPAILKALGL